MSGDSHRPFRGDSRVPLSSTHPEFADELRTIFLDGMMSIDGGSGVTRNEAEANLVVDLCELPDGECLVLIELPAFDEDVWWHEWSGEHDSVLAWAGDAGEASGINLVIHRRT
jgi:hypothetical protein